MEKETQEKKWFEKIIELEEGSQEDQDE